MRAWWTGFFSAVRAEVMEGVLRLKTLFRSLDRKSPKVWGSCMGSVGVLLWCGWAAYTPPNPKPVTHVAHRSVKTPKPSYQLPATPPPPVPTPDYTIAPRAIPKNFRINATMPARPEASVSGAIADVPFSASRDLIRVEDPRVWWESENDDATGDDEDDHLMHWAMEEPFRRLVELVETEGGQLKVQDSYRAVKVHGIKSLHKQGRGIDLTAFDISLGRLSALCWAAGFDWVYLEKAGGLHVHASVNLKGKIRRTFEKAVDDDAS